MKRILKIAAFSIVMVLGSSLRNTASAQYYDNDGNDYRDDNRDVSYQTFYDDLSPYGQWIDYPNYGYVWVPDAGPDFRPYSTNGHWVWTDDYEWMWVSDYDWGWAPFHYGRWEYDNAYGWLWVPGYEWSPAWVAWRDGGDYYGWAPLRPGINISINFNIGGYNPPNDYWCFVPHRYITSPRIYDYYIPRSQNITIINYTNIINYNNYRSGYGFRSGPRRYDAERYTGRINPVRLRDSYNPGRTSYRNNEVSIYRPRINQNTGGRTAAPRQFERYDRNNGGFRNRNTDVTNNGGRVDQQQPRQFERRNADNGNDQIRRQQDQQQPRQFERRNADNGNDQIRRQQDQQQPRQFERRNVEQPRQQEQQQPRQFERRQERQQQPAYQPQQQEQSRRMERRAEPDGNQRSNGNGNGNGGENGRKGRRF